MRAPTNPLPTIRLLLTRWFEYELDYVPKSKLLRSVLLQSSNLNKNGIWKGYWEERGQPWRTEPEIDKKRQTYLEQRLVIRPNIQQGIYPFKGTKLTRADVEWLLTVYKGGLRLAQWVDENQLERKGLDLRGANLSYVDLHNLPLARLRGGLTAEEWREATEEQCINAAVHMEATDLRWTHLEHAELRWAYLESSNLTWAYLEDAHLRHAHLEKACLQWARLGEAAFVDAHLEETDFKGAGLDKVDFSRAILTNAEGIAPQFVDVQWGNTNLSVVKWSQVKMLGDEYKARQKKQEGKDKKGEIRLVEYEAAVRANRQLASVLQTQGLNEDAARFAYRAQVLQKHMLWLQMLEAHVRLSQRIHLLGIWLFSWFMYLLAGYGYKPERSFLAYLLVISGFATAYYLLAQSIGLSLSPLSAFVFSMTSFHGRGFFPGNNIQLDNPLTVLAAFEALVGLIIEVTFIATLT